MDYKLQRLLLGAACLMAIVQTAEQSSHQNDSSPHYGTHASMQWPGPLCPTYGITQANASRSIIIIHYIWQQAPT
jgi:hypothetical protein